MRIYSKDSFISIYLRQLAFHKNYLVYLKKKSALISFGSDPRYSSHLACWSELFGTASPHEIIQDLEELQPLIEIIKVQRNRSETDALFKEYENGEIIYGQKGQDSTLPL